MFYLFVDLFGVERKKEKLLFCEKGLAE